MQEMKRSTATELLEEMLQTLARAKEDAQFPDLLKALESRVRHHGLELPTRCPGEAHQNPHIDHCGQCAPQWGWVGGRIKIR